MTEEEKKFAGGVAVITGAGAGIGMGLAKRAAALGMTVVVTDVSQDRADKVASEIKVAGGIAEALVVDVAQPEELDQLAEEVFARHGSVRLLINNAGIETFGYSWEIPAARWDLTVDVNIRGIIHGVRAFVPRMLATGQEGWIANLSSIGAFGMMPTQTAYIMSKHAIQSFNEGLFLELQHIGAPLHVASVIPGMLKTSIFDAAGGDGEPEAANGHRATMRAMAASHGMDLDEGCKLILEQVAANRFWVSTQPEMTGQVVADRIAYLSTQREPELVEQTRALIETGAG